MRERTRGDSNKGASTQGYIPVRRNSYSAARFRHCDLACTLSQPIVHCF